MADHGDNKLVGSKSEQADTNERLFKAYDAVCEAEESIKEVEKNVENALPKKIDPCSAFQIVNKLSGIANDLISVQEIMTKAVNDALSSTVQQITDTAEKVTSEATDYIKSSAEKAYDKAKSKVEKSSENKESTNSEEQSTTEESSNNEDSSSAESGTKLSVDAKYTKYLATQIILKKFQLIKYRIEYVRTGIEITSATLIKNTYISMMSGKCTAEDPTIASQISTITQVAQTVNTISTVISSILSMINAMTIMNVNGAGMAFFPTPKSITKTDINITNVNQSVTNFIPNAIDLAIEQAGQLFKKNRGIEKKAKVAAMGAKAVASVSNGGVFDPGTLGKLTRFDANAIKNAINAILQALVCAEATPRYESLKISYIRFLTFLVTGFEPAGKRTFGIPGYP